LSRFADARYRALITGHRRGAWPSLQRAGLRLASLPYGGGVCLRNWSFDCGWARTHRATVPVVSVGNLTAGGTGKTPCVEWVAAWFRQRDYRVAILSRGYGSDGGRNDEALVLEENLPDVPHLQGTDRAALAEVAADELESEMLVLDDGFQHRRLARDLDVVLLDATNPWGHGYLLPRGLLREPPSSLQRAGVVVLTRCDQVDHTALTQLRETVARLAPRAVVALATHQPVELVNQEVAPLERLRSQPVAAFCGLGNPEAFRRTLLDLHINLCDFRTFPDHHAYTRTDVEDLAAWARRQPAEGVLATTQKDLVKLRVRRLGERDLWAVRVRFHVQEGREALDRKLQDVLTARY
jgi:tetraacyldisaccharide 4'-kinase